MTIVPSFMFSVMYIFCCFSYKQHQLSVALPPYFCINNKPSHLLSCFQPGTFTVVSITFTFILRIHTFFNDAMHQNNLCCGNIILYSRPSTHSCTFVISVIYLDIRINKPKQKYRNTIIVNVFGALTQFGALDLGRCLR